MSPLLSSAAERYARPGQTRQWRQCRYLNSGGVLFFVSCGVELWRFVVTGWCPSVALMLAREVACSARAAEGKWSSCFFGRPQEKPKQMVRWRRRWKFNAVRGNLFIFVDTCGKKQFWYERHLHGRNGVNWRCVRRGCRCTQYLGICGCGFKESTVRVRCQVCSSFLRRVHTNVLL